MVYLDYNATTPVAPAVLEAMQPFWRTSFANASSVHAAGRVAHEAVERARAQVARAVDATPAEVIFTSSGTESNNAIIKGVAKMSLKKTVAVSATEHPCVLCSARALRDSFAVEFIAVDKAGRVSGDDLADTLQRDCALVSVMLANNETGVVQDIATLCQMVHERGAVFHTDAAQCLGKIPISFKQLGVDAMTLSAHKCYGPKGVAALVVKEAVAWAPLLEGGGHQNGKRSGTENVAGIVGFGQACEMAQQQFLQKSRQLQQWRDDIVVELKSCGAVVFGEDAERLPNTCYFGFPNISGESMVVMLDQSGFAVASGAACSSMKDQPSHVLLAMDYDEAMAHSAVRVSLGVETNEAEVVSFIQTVKGLLSNFKAMGF